MQSWTVGIICYNELGTIRQVFDEVERLLLDFGCDYQIILVDDASTDGSRQIIEEVGAKSEQVDTILHESNQGIGASIRDVYFNAEKDNVVFVPGDGQFEVVELQPFKVFDQGKYICFYRVENQSYSVFRNTLSYLNKLFNATFLGLRLKDVNWVKVYKREILQNLDLKMTSSVVESEICAKLNLLGHTPVEVKSTYQPRTYGESKGASIQNLIRVTRELIKLIWILVGFRFSRNKTKIIL